LWFLKIGELNASQKQFLKSLSKIYKEKYNGGLFTDFKSYVIETLEENKKFIENDLHINTLNCLVSFFSIEYPIFTDENFRTFKTEIDELLNHNQHEVIGPVGGGPVQHHQE